MSTNVHEGGCLCGAVRYRVQGRPLRVGLCHCLDCRKTSGSVFSTFAVWAIAAFEGQGDVSEYDGRGYCDQCGSRVVHLREDEAEIMVGSLDDGPTDLVPEYEVWTVRRERWLAPVPGIAQYERDRRSPPAADKQIVE